MVPMPQAVVPNTAAIAGVLPGEMTNGISEKDTSKRLNKHAYFVFPQCVLDEIPGKIIRVAFCQVTWKIPHPAERNHITTSQDKFGNDNELNLRFQR